PLLEIEKEGVALLLAVVADVDAGFNLQRHDRAQRLAAGGGNGIGVDAFAAGAADEQLGQRLRARQAAGMRRQDSLGAAPYRITHLHRQGRAVAMPRLVGNPVHIGLALRPPRSIETGAASCAIRRAARSSNRLASMQAPSASSFELRTIATLFSMSSCDQPRECAMNGNCGKMKPSSAKKASIWAATIWMLSWPPTMMKPAVLLR